MPMQRDRYPDNWDEIALEIKFHADWTCQECGKPCRKTDEDIIQFFMRVVNHPWCVENYKETGILDVTKHPQRFTLTVAHLDHQPENCDRDNLRALCSVCHLRYDATHHAATRKAKRHQGQLTLEMEME